MRSAVGVIRGLFQQAIDDFADGAIPADGHHRVPTLRAGLPCHLLGMPGVLRELRKETDLRNRAQNRDDRRQLALRDAG